MVSRCFPNKTCGSWNNPIIENRINVTWFYLEMIYIYLYIIYIYTLYIYLHLYKQTPYFRQYFNGFDLEYYCAVTCIYTRIILSHKVNVTQPAVLTSTNPEIKSPVVLVVPGTMFGPAWNGGSLFTWSKSSHLALSKKNQQVASGMVFCELCQTGAINRSVS